MESEIRRDMLYAAWQARLGILRSLESKSQGQILAVTTSDGIKAEADNISHQILVELLTQAVPGVRILSEEAAKKEPWESFRTGKVFVIDPVDGTNNMVHRLPMASVSLAYCEDGVCQIGVVAMLFESCMFAATRGSGADCHKITPEGGYLIPPKASKRRQALSVNQYRRIEEATIGIELAMAADNWQEGSRQPALLRRLLPPTCLAFRVYEGTAATLCHVASGGLGLDVHLASNPWDHAAGALIVEEAGGKVTNVDGSPWDLFSLGILATNGHVHDQAVSLIGYLG